MKTTKPKIHRIFLLLALTVFVGAASGAAAAFVVTSYMVPIPVYRISMPSRSVTSTSTDVAAPPALIKLGGRVTTPTLPQEFLQRGMSPVAAVYRKPKGTTLEERTLTDERLLGQAVAVTSDGWFVATVGVIGNLHQADLSLWHEGVSYSVTKAIVDHINGTVYLKTIPHELTVSAFAQIADLVPGSELWTERRAHVLAPTLVTALVDPRLATEVTSSEVATRRITLDGFARQGDGGSPVWDGRGSLVGLVEALPSEPLRIIPVTSISTSLTSFLSSGGTIRHAYVGVHVRDMAAWRIDGERGELPKRGALVYEDKKAGKPAVIKDSPAAKAGVRAGDVIIGIEHDILDGTSDLGELLSEYRAGTSVVFHFQRNGADMALPVTLGATTSSEPLK